MLALTRREGERIRIGDDVVITVGRIERKRAKIVVEAPQGVKILRDELTRTQTSSDSTDDETSPE